MSKRARDTAMFEAKSILWSCTRLLLANRYKRASDISLACYLSSERTAWQQYRHCVVTFQYKMNIKNNKIIRVCLFSCLSLARSRARALSRQSLCWRAKEKSRSMSWMRGDMPCRQRIADERRNSAQILVFLLSRLLRILLRSVASYAYNRLTNRGMSIFFPSQLRR